MCHYASVSDGAASPVTPSPVVTTPATASRRPRRYRQGSGMSPHRRERVRGLVSTAIGLDPSAKDGSDAGTWSRVGDGLTVRLDVMRWIASRWSASGYRGDGLVDPLIAGRRFGYDNARWKLFLG